MTSRSTNAATRRAGSTSGTRRRRRRTKPNLPDHLLADWADELSVLQELLGSRPKARRDLPPWDNWSGRIRTRIYALVQRYKAEGNLRIISAIVGSLEREPLKVSFRANPYYWALYAARNDGDILMLTYKDISRFAQQMLYAERNDIEPELLVGFAYQQGDENDISRKLASKEREPWYKGRRSG